MKDNKCSNSKKPKSDYQGKRRGKRRPKEVELNVPRDDINKADLRHDNDFSWYAHYPTLLRGVTGINFSTPTGSVLDIRVPGSYKNNSGTTVNTNVQLTNKISGIMSIGFIPTLGTATNNADSVANKVAVQLYSALRMKLGSTASYEPCDTMMYIGAMDSAICLYTLGVAIYGSMRQASPTNLYTLQGLAQAMNVNFDAFNVDLNDFRSFVNRMAIYLTSLQVPADFDVFKRHSWMLQNVFVDSNTSKAQYYCYRLDGYYTYEEMTTGPAYLKFNSITQAWTPDSYIQACNTVLRKLLGSSDITQIQADLGKAFEGDVFAMTQIGEDYLTPVTYSQEVLSQIENAVLMGVPNNAPPAVLPTGYNSFDIYQDNSLNVTNPVIIQRPYMTMPSMNGNAETSDQTKANFLAILDSTKLLNFHKSDVTPEDIIVASRGVTSGLDYGFGDGSTIGLRYAPQYYGTEIYTTGRIFITKGDVGPYGKLDYITFGYVNSYAGTAMNSMLGLISNWSQFDWAPAIYATDSSIAQFYRMQDVDVYGLAYDTTVRDMNMCAVLSEFWSSKFPQLHE